MEPTPEQKEFLPKLQQRYMGTPALQAQIDDLEDLYWKLSKARRAFIEALSRDTQRHHDQVQALVSKYAFAKDMYRSVGGNLRRLTVQKRLEVAPVSEDPPHPSEKDMDELERRFLVYQAAQTEFETLLPEDPQERATHLSYLSRPFGYVFAAIMEIPLSMQLRRERAKARRNQS